VTGVDSTPEMVARSMRAAAQASWARVDFVEACAEQLPFSDGAFDAVLSNGCLNLSADKSDLLADAGFAGVRQVAVQRNPRNDYTDWAAFRAVKP
jgi:ubiquinone/menaquinone biosynthesis C-methylase UbiE